MFDARQTGVRYQMNAVSWVDSLARLLGSLQLDDSSVALIALLAGMVGGYRLTAWHDQMKARRARVTRKSTGFPGRKPD
jgi:hypothetical protein